MPFKFSAVEGFDPELAAKLDADETLQGAISTHIDDSVTNRVDVKADEFKQRMEALDAKRKAAEARASSAPDIDPEELKALKLAAEKSPELQAQLDAMKKAREEESAALQKKTEEVNRMQLDHTTSLAIDEYGRAHPTVAVLPEARDLVAGLMRDALHFDEGANAYRVRDKQGNIVATDEGAATPIDLLQTLRKERPILFAQPGGSGAPGTGTTTGSGEKTITRADFAKLAPPKQSEVARSHTITDG